MVTRTHGHWYRWLVNTAILLMAFAFGITALALFTRFQQSNDRFHAAVVTRTRVDRELDKLTCAFVGIIRESDGNLDTPGTPEYIALQQLDIPPAKLAVLKEKSHEANARALKRLPAHAPCPPPR